MSWWTTILDWLLGEPDPPAPAPAPTPPPLPTTVSEDMRREVNAQRASRGLPPLAADPELTAEADAHSRFMAQVRQLIHSPHGPVDDPWWGECIAVGQPTVAEVVAAWLGDPPHREILLDPEYVRFGGACSIDPSGRMWWTADFGRPS